MGHSNPRLSFLEDFFLGGIAAVVSKTVAAPLENYKICVQLDRPLPDTATGWFRGNLDKIRSAMRAGSDASAAQKFFTNILAGGVAGALTLTLVYPLDTIRTYQAAGLDWHWSADLYAGFGISVLGIVLYRSAYFGLYGATRPLLGSARPNFLVSFAMGYTVTVLAGVLTYPIDTIRRKMMMDPEFSAWKLYSQEGVAPFFSGCLFNIVRGAAGALALTFFDSFRRWYISNRS